METVPITYTQLEIAICLSECVCVSERGRETDELNPCLVPVGAIHSYEKRRGHNQSEYVWAARVSNLEPPKIPRGPKPAHPPSRPRLRASVSVRLPCPQTLGRLFFLPINVSIHSPARWMNLHLRAKRPYLKSAAVASPRACCLSIMRFVYCEDAAEKTFWVLWQQRRGPVHLFCRVLRLRFANDGR